MQIKIIITNFSNTLFCNTAQFDVTKINNYIEVLQWSTILKL